LIPQGASLETVSGELHGKAVLLSKNCKDVVH